MKARWLDMPVDSEHEVKLLQHIKVWMSIQHVSIINCRTIWHGMATKQSHTHFFSSMPESYISLEFLVYEEVVNCLSQQTLMCCWQRHRLNNCNNTNWMQLSCAVQHFQIQLSLIITNLHLIKIASLNPIWIYRHIFITRWHWYETF